MFLGTWCQGTIIQWSLFAWVATLTFIASMKLENSGCFITWLYVYILAAVHLMMNAKGLITFAIWLLKEEINSLRPKKQQKEKTTTKKAKPCNQLGEWTHHLAIVQDVGGSGGSWQSTVGGSITGSSSASGAPLGAVVAIDFSSPLEASTSPVLLSSWLLLSSCSSEPLSSSWRISLCLNHSFAKLNSSSVY